MGEVILRRQGICMENWKGETPTNVFRMGDWKLTPCLGRMEGTSKGQAGSDMWARERPTTLNGLFVLWTYALNLRPLFHLPLREHIPPFSSPRQSPGPACPCLHHGHSPFPVCNAPKMVLSSSLLLRLHEAIHPCPSPLNCVLRACPDNHVSPPLSSRPFHAVQREFSTTHPPHLPSGLPPLVRRHS
jgi:hypothetical protein